MGAVTTNLDRRSQLAARMRQEKASVAHRVTIAFLQRHPEFVARDGARAHQGAEENASYHIDFLAASVQTASPEVFGRYAGWAARVLAARGIPSTFLIENIQQVSAALLSNEPESEADWIRATVNSALSSLTFPALELEGDDGSNLTPSCELFLETILCGDRRAALQIALEALRDTNDPAKLYVDLFQRSLHEVGRRWERGAVSVAQEHVASATVQYVLALLYTRFPPAPESRGKALITGVEGEHHQLGANLVADMLETQGFSVLFLGTNVPESAILRTVAAESPTIVGISATMAFNLPAVISLVRAIQAQTPAGKRPRILLGGAAFASAPQLGHELEVHGTGSDVREALALATSG